MARTAAEVDKRRLPDVCDRAFSLVMTLGEGRDYGDPQQLRERIGGMFGEMERDGRDAGIPSEDLNLARFALTAFIDETIARSDWFGKQVWAGRPLALDYYKTNNAGDEFFDHLEHLRQRPDAKTDLLEVFYNCMTLGFEGKYALTDPRQLRALIETIGRDLERVRGRAADLSPHWEPPDTLLKRVRSEIPMWIVTAFCVIGVFVLFVALRYLSLSHAGGIADRLRDLIR
jgi:type VI secretion system protein ImpK